MLIGLGSSIPRCTHLNLGRSLEQIDQCSKYQSVHTMHPYMRARVVRDELVVMDGGGGGGSSVALVAKALFLPCAHILPLTKTALLRKIDALNPCECGLNCAGQDCMDCSLRSIVPRLRQYSAL